MSCYVDDYSIEHWGRPNPAFELTMGRVCDCGHAETRHLVGSVHRCLESGCRCRALRFWAPGRDRAVKS